MVLCVMPTLYRLVIHPEGNGSTLNHCIEVFRPIDDSSFGLAHEPPPTVMTGDQITALQKDLIRLGNRNHTKWLQVSKIEFTFVVLLIS